MTNNTAHSWKRLSRLFEIKTWTGIVLLQENATHNRSLIVQNLVQLRGWELLTHPSYSLISSHVSAGCLHVWKNIFGLNIFNRKTITPRHSLPLHIAWTRSNTELQLIVCTQMGKERGQSGWLHWVEDIWVNIVERHYCCDLVFCNHSKIVHNI